MAINYANRPDDRRRTKYRTWSNRYPDISLVEQLKNEIAQRPIPLYATGQFLKTPIGYREIVGRYYSNSNGWMYRVHLQGQGRFIKTYPENELEPLELSHVLQLALNVIAPSLAL